MAIVKEDVRALCHPVWLEQLLTDVRFGLRLLRRTPLFTVAVVLSLALGSEANTAIFSLLNAVALRPLPSMIQRDCGKSVTSTPARLSVRWPVTGRCSPLSQRRAWCG